MTALAKDRKTDQFGTPDVVIPQKLSFPVAAATTIWGGSLVATDASGNALPAAGAAPTFKVWGRAARQAPNTVAMGVGSAGDIRVEVDQGAFYFANSTSTDLITTAHVGRLCYVVDDQTVALTAGIAAMRPVAGVILAVRSDGQVAVQVGLPSNVQFPQSINGVTPAQVGNDIILTAAAVINGATYTTGALAAASTFTLPAGAADGTIIYVVADGITNGFTLQFRDATGPVNLTAALTASKRIFAVCEKKAGLWYVNASSAP